MDPRANRDQRAHGIPRRPLATARPGLDYLRSAFIAAWESGGATCAGDLAGAYAQAAQDSDDRRDDPYLDVARWIGRRQARSRLLALRCS